MKARHRVTSSRSRRTAVWLAGIFLLCFAYFLPLSDADAGARLDTALAIVQRHTLAIDDYHTNTVDLAFFRGHYYSVTAPGQALLGLPIVVEYQALLRLEGGQPRADDIGEKSAAGTLDYFLLLYLEGIATVAIPGIILLLLFFWFLGYFSESLVNRALLALALGLGTIVFPYAHTFYAHVPVAGLLFAGFVLVYIVNHPEAEHGPRARWLAQHPQVAAFLVGLLLGSAEIFEYPAALISLLIVVYAAIRLPRGIMARLAAGALPGLLLVMALNYAVYRNPFVTGYSAHSVSYKQELGHGLLAALHLPPPMAAVYGTSFSPYRGLFFLSPFLLLAYPGLALWKRQGGHEWALFLALPVLYLLAMATYPMWYAGDAVGPRFLIPALPFLAMPIIFVLDRATRWPVRLAVYGLIGISAVGVWAEALGTRYGFPVARNQNPLFTYSLPHIARGDFMPSLGSPIFGISSKAAILPLFVLIAVWSFFLWRRATRREAVSTPPAMGASRLSAAGE